MKKGSASAARFDAYRHARSAGDIFDLHPGPPRVARDDLDWGLAKQLCSTPGSPPLGASRPLA